MGGWRLWRDLGLFGLALVASSLLFSRELAPRPHEPTPSPTLNGSELTNPPPPPKRSEPKSEPIFAAEPPEPEPT